MSSDEASSIGDKDDETEIGEVGDKDDEGWSQKEKEAKTREKKN